MVKRTPTATPPGSGGHRRNNYNQKSNNNNNHHRHNNPKRGGPGVFLSSETGKERRCQREGLDILRHYLHRTTATEASAPTSTDAPPRTNDSPGGTALVPVPPVSGAAGTEGLSLEEEIAMLKRGASTDEVLGHLEPSGGGMGVTGRKRGGRAPFDVYDTGCRGTVFLMCALPGCAIEVDRRGCDGGTEDDVIGAEGGTVDSPPSDVDNGADGSKKRKIDDGTTSAASDTGTTTTKKQKTRTDADARTTTRTDAKPRAIESEPSTSPPWDPVLTVRSILHDIQTEDPHTTITPSSRFVTRMIPIHLTCYASMAEMEPAVRALLRSKFLPFGLEHRTKREANGVVSDGEEDVNLLPSFKIDFRRRNCSNVERGDVIDMVATLVKELTNGAAEDESVGADTAAAKESSDVPDKIVEAEEAAKVAEVVVADGDPTPDTKQQLFRVDLKDPDYTILINICHTLCGMSVVPNPGDFHNFNLTALREKVAGR